MKVLSEKDLSYAEKQKIKKAVFPATEKDNKVRYPIHDKSHARNALSRVAQYDKLPDWAKERGIESLEELKEKVRNAVEKEYPGIEVSESKVYKVTEDKEIVLNGERYLLEKGDRIRIHSRSI